MVMCRAPRTLHGETSTEDRYFITSSTHRDVEKMAAAVRNHWGIENGLHWVLDTAFQEDQSRIRLGYAAENMATVRKMALNVVKGDRTKKGGVKAKRLQAAWNDEYLCHILMTM